jgi:hypothetical protein
MRSPEVELPVGPLAPRLSAVYLVDPLWISLALSLGSLVDFDLASLQVLL